MSIGPFRHVPQRLKKMAFHPCEERPSFLDDCFSVAREMHEGGELNQKFLVELSGLIASAICRGDLSIGIVYELGNGYQAVFFLDVSMRCASFSGVRFHCWMSENGYVSSDVFSPW